MKLWHKVTLFLLGLLVLFILPPTRALLIFLLPLGGRWDDIAFWVIVGLLGILFWARGIIHRARIKAWLDRLFYS